MNWQIVSCRYNNSQTADQKTLESKTIEVLRKDLDKGLLDLQRERKLSDDLRKQQDDKLILMKELQTILVEHKKTIITIATEYQEKVELALTSKDESEQK